MPGAAAALVAAADHWEDGAVQAPAYADSTVRAPSPPQPVAVIAVTPMLLEVPPRAAPVSEPPPPAAPVTLGFADGAQVDLDADDPRVRTFRAAAAALLESPRA